MDYKYIKDSFKYQKDFRGITLHAKSQRQLVEMALFFARKQNIPVSTLEFVYDLHVTRFGGHIFDLRKAGWVINTDTKKLDDGRTGNIYTLVARPDEDLQLFSEE
tara:strand:+ start:82 stop:396 length:315 start_codon:yes stop_codon:yes gene_type:complete